MSKMADQKGTVELADNKKDQRLSVSQYTLQQQQMYQNPRVEVKVTPATSHFSQAESSGPVESSDNANSFKKTKSRPAPLSFSERIAQRIESTASQLP